jgi:uncharacterized glyoxalase superfamily protein PhnB
MPLHFATTVIYVEKDAAKVLDFYHRAFGFSIKYYDDNIGFGELETGSTSIMISNYEGGRLMMGDAFKTAKDHQPANIEIAFTTDDVAGAYNKAITAGARSVAEPATHPWGQTAAYVFSIEGTLIGILTPPPAQ